MRNCFLLGLSAILLGTTALGASTAHHVKAPVLCPGCQGAIDAYVAALNGGEVEEAQIEQPQAKSTANNWLPPGPVTTATPARTARAVGRSLLPPGPSAAATNSQAARTKPTPTVNNQTVTTPHLQRKAQSWLNNPTTEKVHTEAWLNHHFEPAPARTTTANASPAPARTTLDTELQGFIEVEEDGAPVATTTQESDESPAMKKARARARAIARARAHARARARIAQRAQSQAGAVEERMEVTSN